MSASDIEIPLTTFFQTELGPLKVYRNGWAWGRCPFHDDKNPSFTVNLELGAYKCMACRVHGFGIAQFASDRYGLDEARTQDYLANWPDSFSNSRKEV